MTRRDSVEKWVTHRGPQTSLSKKNGSRDGGPTYKRCVNFLSKLLGSLDRPVDLLQTHSFPP